MIWMKSTELMRKYIELLRYDTSNPLPFILILVIVALVLTNLFNIVFLREADNLEKCFLAMKDILTILALFSCTIKRFVNPEETIRLTKLIEEQFFIDRYQLDDKETKWERIRLLYDQKRKDLESASDTIIAFVYASSSGYILKYLFSDLLGGSLEDNPRGFPTPFVAHNPFDYDQTAFLVYIYTLQSFLIVLLSLEVFNGYASLWLCVKKIMTDFETIYILLDEIANNYPDSTDYLITLNKQQENFRAVDGSTESIRKDIRVNAQCNQKLQINWHDDASTEEKLRKDMRLIAHFHQNLNRNQDYCARASGYSILIVSFLVALDTCSNIFLMLQANDPKMFTNYGAVCILTNIPLLLNYYIGQQISNQNGIFRQCLAEVSWIDKPQWFKQSLLIMMTRANVDTEFKPYGLFVLNLTSYKDLVKAAFSFGNVFYQRNKARK